MPFGRPASVTVTHYIKICRFEERRGIGWWKMGIWRLKGRKRDIDKGVCPVCRKEEGWGHILQCEGAWVRWLGKKSQKYIGRLE
jgi:hypothetical protein